MNELGRYIFSIAIAALLLSVISPLLQKKGAVGGLGRCTRQWCNPLKMLLSGLSLFNHGHWAFLRCFFCVWLLLSLPDLPKGYCQPAKESLCSSKTVIGEGLPMAPQPPCELHHSLGVVCGEHMTQQWPEGIFLKLHV